MKERQILFSAPMIRALLDGTKTQTRRLVKFDITGPNPPSPNDYYDWYKGGKWQGAHRTSTPFHKSNAALLCPYGQVGDQLWVREAFAHVGNIDPGWLLFRASDYKEQCRAYGFDVYLPENEVKWKPSIHMPRKASRIQLEITGVRVERLNEISEADAVSEGVEIKVKRIVKPYSNPVEYLKIPAVEWYRDLWETINGAGSWAANPWVWVIEFNRIS